MSTLKREVLFEFDLVVDTDLAIYNYIKFNFGGSEFLNQELMNLTNQDEIKLSLIARRDINPLNMIIPGMDTNKMYLELLNDKYADVLKYALVYDTFPLCITLLNCCTTPTRITILCKNKLERDYINKCNPRLNTIVVANKQNVALSKYDALGVKYLPSLLAYGYGNVVGLDIYYAKGGFNANEDGTGPMNLIAAFDIDGKGANQLKEIDLYVKLKFRYLKTKDFNYDITRLEKTEYDD